MHAAKTLAAPAVLERRTRAGRDARQDGRLQAHVQQGLNLFLPLKTRAQMPALLEQLKLQQDVVNQALAGLHYVHFARFLPSPDGSTLMVITVFDGDLQSYLMDFVAVLGEVFNLILEFVRGAPPLPVQAYPRAFCEFVDAHNVVEVQPWAAYPSMTVLDILGARLDD